LESYLNPSKPFKRTNTFSGYSTPSQPLEQLHPRTSSEKSTGDIRKSALDYLHERESNTKIALFKEKNAQKMIKSAVKHLEDGFDVDSMPLTSMDSQIQKLKQNTFDVENTIVLTKGRRKVSIYQAALNDEAQSVENRKLLIQKFRSIARGAGIFVLWFHYLCRNLSKPIQVRLTYPHDRNHGRMGKISRSLRFNFKQKKMLQ
jgi:hypothetical protein